MERGKSKLLSIPQQHVPGKLMQLDWTCMNELQITITGVPFKHLLSYAVLTYSNWEWAENILAFGLPGRGKSHFLAALGHELIMQHQYSVLFIPTFRLIQELLVAKQNLMLDQQLKKYSNFDVIIIDDIGYVQHNRDEMEVLFTFLADRYERKSLMISSNLMFSQWDKIFKDPMTTMAAIDRLVHHSIILEFNGDSVREKQARQKLKR